MGAKNKLHTQAATRPVAAATPSAAAWVRGRAPARKHQPTVSHSPATPTRITMGAAGSSLTLNPQPIGLNPLSPSARRRMGRDLALSPLRTIGASPESKPHKIPNATTVLAAAAFRFSHRHARP